MRKEERQALIFEIYATTGMSFEYLNALSDKELVRIYTERVTKR